MIPLRQIAADSIREEHGQLKEDLPPVVYAPRPFFHDILSHKVQHFHQCIVCWKDGFAFGHLPQLTMVAFYDIGCVDDLADLWRIFKEGGKFRPIVSPGTDDQRVFVPSDSLKFMEGFQPCIFAGRLVNRL